MEHRRDRHVDLSFVKPIPPISSQGVPGILDTWKSLSMIYNATATGQTLSCLHPFILYQIKLEERIALGLPSLKFHFHRLSLTLLNFRLEEAGKIRNSLFLEQDKVNTGMDRGAWIDLLLWLRLCHSSKAPARRQSLLPALLDPHGCNAPTFARSLASLRQPLTKKHL
jgi:hypothetical protein